MKYLFLITNTFVYILLLIYHMHMFQLNSYSLVEEKRFLLENFYPNLGRVLGSIISFILLIIGFLFNIEKTMLILAVLLNIFEILGNKPAKTSKISLKYTPRVMRMMVTSGVVYVGIFLLLGLFAKKYLYILLQSTHMIVPFIIILSNIINRPLEKSINNGYISDAMDKISSMTSLIVIGITGSYGKTTMKTILEKLLSEDYNVLATPYNYNTTLGVVITIREYLSPLHEIFICEMGAKKNGEIKEICDIVHPRYGVLTSIGPMHLESFKTMKNIENTKFELIDSLGNKGKAFLNYDDEIIKSHKDIKCDIVPYALENSQGDFVPFNIKTTDKGSTFDMKFPEKDDMYTFRTKLLGKHNVLNLSGGIAVAYNLGVKIDTLILRTRLIDPPPHRLELKRTGFGLMIDDAYNSNPAGSKAALEVLAQFDLCKILVTPGMVELGEKEDKLNYEFGKEATKVCDYIILVGKNQTKSIQKALKDEEFSKKKLYVVDKVEQAISLCESIKAPKGKIALFENDLPDNYG